MAALSDFSGALAAGVLAALCTARVLPPEEWDALAFRWTK